MTFSTRLRELRESAKLTQAQLANAAGMSAGSIANLEQGFRKKPTWETIQKLAAALDVGTEVFSGLEAEETKEASRARGRPRKATPVAPSPPKKPRGRPKARSNGKADAK